MITKDLIQKYIHNLLPMPNLLTISTQTSNLISSDSLSINYTTTENIWTKISHNINSYLIIIKLLESNKKNNINIAKLSNKFIIH
jgi:hypothetical protein